MYIPVLNKIVWEFSNDVSYCANGSSYLCSTSAIRDECIETQTSCVLGHPQKLMQKSEICEVPFWLNNLKYTQYMLEKMDILYNMLLYMKAILLLSWCSVDYKIKLYYVFNVVWYYQDNFEKEIHSQVETKTEIC